MNEAIDKLMVFSGTLNSKMVRARERCYDISGSERLMGYEESAKMYRDMAEEISPLALWCHQEENRRMQAGLIGPSEDYVPEELAVRVHVLNVGAIREAFQHPDEFRCGHPPAGSCV